MATQPSGHRPQRTDQPGISSASADAAFPGYAARALLLWPGLDRARLAEAKGDPRRIARLVSRRTNLPPEAILRMLGVRAEAQAARDAAAEDAGPDRS